MSPTTLITLIEPAIFLLEKLHCPLHFLWKEAGGRSREPASVFSFIYLSVAAPPRPASCMVNGCRWVGWHGTVRVGVRRALCVVLVVKRNIRVNGFCYGAGHRIGEAIAIATCERRTSFPGTRGCGMYGYRPQCKGGKICTRAGTQAPVPRSVRARQRECQATGVRQTHARTQKRPAPYAVSSSSARLQQEHVGR